ncbi:MAG: Uma2 family endonuclease [Solirubrobacteraceae bacterium]
MPTLVRDPPPVELEALLERRRRLGQDRWDEERDGVFYMNPLAQLRASAAEPAGGRDPGPARQRRRARRGRRRRERRRAGQLRDPRREPAPPGAGGTYVPTAALAIEIVSPDEDTWEKLPLYARRGVEELAIVDPRERRVTWLALDVDGEYGDVENSRVIELSAAELAERLDWPR